MTLSVRIEIAANDIGGSLGIRIELFIKSCDGIQIQIFDLFDTQTLFDYLLPGHYQPGLKNTLTLKLMRDLIRNRLISVLREQKSLVYSPYISLMYEGIPQGTFYFDINASADNDNSGAWRE